MAETTTLFAKSHIIPEVTKGTNLPATTHLQATAFDLQQATTQVNFRPQGNKFPTLAVPGKDWATFDIEGKASYDDLVYLWASNISYPGPSGIGPYDWVFTPDVDGEDTIKSYSIEQGDVVRAKEISYGLVNEVELSWDREEVDIRGSGIGQAIADGITLTAATNEVGILPVAADTVDVFSDTTSAGLGTTKLTRALAARFRYGNRYAPLWTINSAEASFAAHIETEPTAEVELTLEANAEGMDFLTAWRAGAFRYVELGFTDGTYTDALQFALKVSDAVEWRDNDGVYAVVVTLMAFEDAVWGSGQAFTIAAQSAEADVT